MTKRRQKSDFSLPELQQFFESELANQAAASLSNSVCIELHIDGDSYQFTRERGKNCFRPGAAKDADFVFWVPTAAMQKILSQMLKTPNSIATLGLQIFDLILSSDPQLKIKFRMQTGFLALLQKGYWGVLLAGGPEVLTYLREKGLGSLGQLRSLISSWKKG